MITIETIKDVNNLKAFNINKKEPTIFNIRGIQVINTKPYNIVVRSKEKSIKAILFNLEQLKTLLRIILKYKKANLTEVINTIIVNWNGTDFIDYFRIIQMKNHYKNVNKYE